MARVAQMAKLRQGDLRLTLAEACELSAVLAHVLAQHAAPPAAPSKPPSTVPHAVDGGSFKD